jgi:hypothetical protein
MLMLFQPEMHKRRFSHLKGMMDACNLVTVIATLKIVTVTVTTAMTVPTMETVCQPLSLIGGYTEEDDINEEDLAFSDDEVDLYGDAGASLSFTSLVNTLPDPLDEVNEVLNFE